jgi:flagellar assembly factor FliW
MLVKTKYFGEVDLDEKKVLTFENGMMGFEEFKKYTILYDIEKEQESTISWLQSLDEPDLAFPVINPFILDQSYNPTVNDEYLESLGKFEEADLVVLLTVTVPEKIENITANFKAPIVINAAAAKGCQVIVENQDYKIKQEIYELLKQRKEDA